MGGTWTPRTPDWVVPPVSQIADEHWLSYAMLRNTRRPWAAGVACAIAWIRGGRVGPITERDEQPVTRALAEAESWAAEAVRDPSCPPPLGLIYAQLKVVPARPQSGHDVNYCVGVWLALRWVLGVPGQEAPLPVPRRHPDGTLYTGDDLYAEVLRGKMERLSPEQRATIRRESDRQASRFVHYDGQITAIQQAMGAN